jgi:hypothetical protein
VQQQHAAQGVKVATAAARGCCTGSSSSRSAGGELI